MVKKDLIDILYRRISLPKKAIKAIVEEMVTIIKDTLSNGEDIYISSFGIFSPYTRNGIVRRHPKTGKKIKIGNKIAVSFRAASALKRELNRKDSK